jgi:hypothetical protein
MHGLVAMNKKLAIFAQGLVTSGFILSDLPKTQLTSGFNLGIYTKLITP